MIDAKSIFLSNYDIPHYFKDCTDRRSEWKDLCGLLILADLLQRVQYATDWRVRTILASAGHDEIYLSGTIDTLNKVATEEDILNLMRCGIYYSEYEDSLYMLA